jgi:hypothetical protein
MKGIYIKSALLVASTLLTASFSQAKISFPAHFTCTTGSGVTLEGIIPEEPQVFPAKEQAATFTLNGVSGAASYDYNPHCFLSRGGAEICPAPNEIEFDLLANVHLPDGSSGTKFNGTLTIYDTETFVHINEIEPSSPDWWYTNGTCAWN